MHRLIVAALAVALGVGCRSEPALPSDTLVVALEAAPRTLDPRLATSDYDEKAVRLVHAGLLTNDTPDGHPALDLAARFEAEGDRTYVATLRPDAFFHDGRPVTVADVVATFRALQADAVASPYAAAFADVRIETRGERQIAFVLREPSAPFPEQLDMGILPAHRLSAEGAYREGPMIGAGPFAVERRYADGTLLLTAHTAYHGGTSPVGHVALRPVADDNARLIGQLAGAIHLVQNATSPMMLPVVSRDESLAVESSASSKYTYVAFRLDHPILSDLRVRRAIALAIDREQLIAHRFAGFARLSTGLLPPRHWAYNGDVATYAYAPELARALLDDAGYSIGEDGCRFALTFKTSENRFRRNLATLIAGQLAEVGICVTVRSFEWGTFYGDIQSGNFELTSLQWVSIQDPDFLHWVFHSASIPTADGRAQGGNRGGYRNAEVDALLDAARTTLDPAARAELYAQVQVHVAADLPYVSLWHEDNIVVRNTGLRGYRAVPNARFRGLVDARWTPPAASTARP